jgi:hypothetical protein
MLLHYSGDQCFEVFDGFTAEQRGDTYADLKKSFTEYFTPKQNTTYEIFKFRQAVQQQQESIDAYHTRLRSLAALCEFHDKDSEILSQILQGCTSARLRRKALKENYNLKQVLDEARADELSEVRAAEMERSAVSNSIDTSVQALGARRRQQGGNPRGNGGSSSFRDHQPGPRGGGGDFRGQSRDGGGSRGGSYGGSRGGSYSSCGGSTFYSPRGESTAHSSTQQCRY